MIRFVLFLCLLLAGAEGVNGQVRSGHLSGDVGTRYLLAPEFQDTGFLMKEIRDAYQLGRLNPDSAISLLHTYLIEARKHGYLPAEINMLISLGILQSAKGRYSRSLEYYRGGLALAAVADDLKAHLPVLYNNIANSFRFMGRYESALQYYYYAIATSSQYPGNLSTSHLYNNMASLLQQTGRQDQGFEYLKIAERTAIKEHNLKILAGVLVNKGVYYAHAGNWDSSEASFRRAKSIAEELDSDNLRSNVLSNLGTLYLMQERPEKALKMMQESISYIDRLDVYYRNGVRIALGEVYTELQQYEAAEAVLKQALKNAEESGLKADLYEISLILSKLYAAQSRFADAYYYRDRAAEINDSLSGVSVSNRLSALEVRYRTVEKDRQILQQQLLIERQHVQLREQQVWILISAICVLLVIIGLAVVYLYYRQRQRRQNQQLKLLQQEQEIGQLKAMMKGEEQERTRIARDLHDGIGGMLAAIKMHLAAIKKQFSDPVAIPELEEVMQMVADTAREVRQTSHNLMPDVLLRYSLPDALRIYCDHINVHDQLQIDLQFYGNLEEMEPSVALSIYRMVQELIQNILKHAQASQAAVVIREHAGALSIIVEDNGKGFKSDGNTGLGLQQIRNRVQALRGFFEVESKEGSGTTACIELELLNLEEDNQPTV